MYDNIKEKGVFAMKKVLSLILSFSILCCSMLCFDISALASEDEVISIAGFVDEYKNTFKQNLIDRKTSFGVKLDATGYSGDIGEAVSSGFNELLDYAFAPSANANEGDYIKYNVFESYYEYSVLDSIGRKTVEVNYNISYNTNKEQEDIVASTVAAQAERINRECSNDFTKIKAVNDYVCQITEYDYDNVSSTKNGLSHYSAFGAINNHLAVCQGYSLLFYSLCTSLGIENRIATSEDHMWNIVRLGDAFYHVDSTWNDAYDNYTYFMKGQQDFKNDRGEHTRNDDLVGNAYYAIAQSGYCEHVYGDAKVEEGTCVSKGKIIKSCVICGSQSIMETSLGNHVKVVDIPASEPTCASVGYTEKSHCSKCGEVLSYTSVVPKLAHSYKAVTKQPTCTKAGYTTYTCTVCSYSYNGDDVAALGHDYGKNKKCIRCKEALKPPAKPTFSKVKAYPKKALIAVTVKKAGDADGYEINTALDKKFKKSKKKAVVKKSIVKNYKIKKLKKNKTYYVRVRAYKIVNGKKIYSSWSSTKKIKLK